jgi:hypothetical protein
MIHKYSIPIASSVQDPREYALKWFNDCLTRCGLSQYKDDYILTIDLVADGCLRAVFLYKKA